jgi:CheY-like chemotaxis protein
MSAHRLLHTKAMLLSMAFCFCSLLSLPLKAAVLQLHETSANQSVIPWLSIHETVDDSILPAQLAQTGWQPYDKPLLHVGLTTHNQWFRLQINNTGAETIRILQFKRAAFAHIYLYSQTKQGDVLFREAGSASAQQRGDADVPGYGFRLHIPAGFSEHVFRVQSDFPLNSPLVLGTSNEMLRGAQNSAGFFGAALGIVGGSLLALFSIGRIGLSLRLIYSFFIAGIIFLAMTDRGVFGTWWLNFPNSQPLYLVLNALLLSALHVWLYASILMRLRLKPNTISKHLLALLASIMLALLITLTLPTQWAAISALFVPLGASICAATILLCHKRYFQPAPTAMRHVTTVAALNVLLQGLLLVNQTSWLLGGFEPYQLHLIGHILLLPWLILALKNARPVAVPAKHPPTKTQPLQRSIDTPPTVLIVEDNEWVRQVLAGLLKKLGCNTLIAYNGEDALHFQHQRNIDLVLMDCDMPVLDGISATQLWRQYEAGLGLPNTPILAVTAHVSADMRQQTHEAGMNDFLAKPVDLRLLRRALQRWVPGYH